MTVTIYIMALHAIKIISVRVGPLQTVFFRNVQNAIRLALNALNTNIVWLAQALLLQVQLNIMYASVLREALWQVTILLIYYIARVAIQLAKHAQDPMQINAQNVLIAIHTIVIQDFVSLTHPQYHVTTMMTLQVQLWTLQSKL